MPRKGIYKAEHLSCVRPDIPVLTLTYSNLHMLVLWGAGLQNLFLFRCCKNSPLLFLKKKLTRRAFTRINNKVTHATNLNWEVSATKLTFQINVSYF